MCAERVPNPLTLCWSCAALAGDALVFLRRPESSQEQADAKEALLSVLPGRPTGEQLSLASRGHQAVAVVPSDETDRIRSLFRRHDVEVVVSPRSTARAVLPVGLKVVVTVTLVAGTLAGLAVEPLLVVTSPLMALLLWMAAQRRLRAPLAGLGD